MYQERIDPKRAGTETAGAAAELDVSSGLLVSAAVGVGRTSGAAVQVTAMVAASAIRASADIGWPSYLFSLAARSRAKLLLYEP